MVSAYKFREIFRRAQEDIAYWTEGAILDFTDEMSHQMAVQNVSRSELARRLETSPAYITKILRGDSNFTLESMVKITRALGCDLRIQFEPVQSKSNWFALQDRLDIDYPPMPPSAWLTRSHSIDFGTDDVQTTGSPYVPITVAA